MEVSEMAERMKHDVEPDGTETCTWTPRNTDYTNFRVARYPKGHFGVHVRVRRRKCNEGFLADSGEVSKLIEALQRLNFYPAAPEPFRWAALPDAFIGELGCYYPARKSEITELERRGLIERDEDEDEIDDVPVWRPTWHEEGKKQTGPEEVEAALVELSKAR